MRPFRLAAYVFGTLALLLLGFLGIGLLLPSHWTVSRERWMEASPEALFGHLDAASAWGDWTPSPETGVDLFGPERGEGSGRRWDDPRYGKGEWVVTRSDPGRELRYRVDVEGGAIRVEGRMELRPEGEGTRVRWTEEGDFGWNPLLGYLAGRMSEMQGSQLEASLEALARRVAADGDPPRGSEPTGATSPRD